ncbi:type II toxin-antitoxin system RelE/ParE family toxin [Acidiplasma sp. MBA-1]|uniref:type II toxin-antitoxin system RelE family toxin n=1 Tax=Acidiplasma TaxID=507753 RepID=UPI0009E233CC
MCDNYSIDVSAIEDYIKKVRDKNIKDQIKNKICAVKKNPYIGATKTGLIANYRAVKVNRQKIVILYKIGEKYCIVIFINIGNHDEFYGRTYGKR